MKKILAGIVSFGLIISCFAVDAHAEEAGTPSAIVVQESAPGQTTGLVAKKASAKLKPGAVKKLKAKGIRGGVSLTWGKTSGISGYQVYMKVFVRVKGVKTKYNLMKVTKSRKYRKKMLVKGMKYGFMVRTYKKVNGKKVYGDFRKVIKRAK